jgi:hypothetical protein
MQGDNTWRILICSSDGVAIPVPGGPAAAKPEGLAATSLAQNVMVSGWTCIEFTAPHELHRHKGRGQHHALMHHVYESLQELDHIQATTGLCPTEVCNSACMPFPMHLLMACAGGVSSGCAPSAASVDQHNLVATAGASKRDQYRTLEVYEHGHSLHEILQTKPILQQTLRGFSVCGERFRSRIVRPCRTVRSHNACFDAQ